MDKQNYIHDHLLKAGAKNPELEDLFVKIARRVECNQDLKGRIKLGNGLPDDMKSALLAIFPNYAIEIKTNDDVILRLDRIADSPEEEHLWIDALRQILRLYDTIDAKSNRVTIEELRKITGRGRLLYPELNCCWQAVDDQPKEFLRIFLLKEISLAQEGLLAMAEAVQWLSSDHEPVGLMDLSARFFKDSKALKNMPHLVKILQEWLILLRYGDSSVSNIDAYRDSILPDYGIFENVTSSKVTLFGPLTYIKQGKTYDWPMALYRSGESATLSWDNLRDIEKVVLLDQITVITCENETPFNQLIREKHPGLIIYTAGYPNSAVQRLLKLLSTSTSKVQHWGDSDLDGLLIASTLQKNTPLSLWRCDLEELNRHQDKLIPLTDSQKTRIKNFVTNHPDCTFIKELKFTLENGWLEQESWHPPFDLD